tara:strand:- start:834 stop:1067 length:234 start_codon:yes stop_codon:yes gene_type:complete
MIYKVSLKENINHLVEVRFFTNKNKAIRYGKSQAKNLSYENEFDSSVITDYEVESFTKPKTQKEWVMFLNFHSHCEW